MSKSKNILITGVSTGIGYDVAKVFLKNGYHVYGSVRNPADAERLNAEFGDGFTALTFDVTDTEGVFQAAAALEAEIGKEGLCGLVNNAGIAVGGPFIDLPLEEFRHQFDVNVFGLIAVTKAFLPLLGAKENPGYDPGRIVQISSVAGRHGMPFLSAYAGSKYAVEGITESMRKELMLYGIEVILIEPGPIKTHIWGKSTGEATEEKFKHSAYYSALRIFETKFVAKAIEDAWTSEKAATIIYKAFVRKKPKVRVLIVPGKFKNWTIPHLLPTRTVDKIIAKAIRLIK